MIPPKTHAKWAAIVKGDVVPKFTVFAGNMMLSTCQRKLARDKSPEVLRACIDEAHAFFSKYENMYASELLRHF
jgi:hypothetical protein